MRVKLRGKVWDVVVVPKMPGTPCGECDGPHIKNKQIRLRADCADDLEIVLHEGLHACFWDADEEAITESAHDLARYLARVLSA